MLDFFRKRFSKTAVKSASSNPVSQPAVIAEVVVPDRQIAMSQAEELAGDEAAAADFILHCEFAEARLAAAKYIHSRPMVERVLAAMRNHDRRVVKMMQARLEVCKQWEADEQLANYCVTEAQRLLGTVHLTPNQVADLDKQWQQIQHIVPPLQQAFDQARLRLQARLAEQVRLQRAVVDALARVRAWVQDPDFLASADGTQKLGELQQAVRTDAVSPELASLPRNLLPDFDSAVTECRALLQRMQQCQEGIAARQAQLVQWEVAQLDTLDEQSILREWRNLPSVPDASLLLPLQQRLDELLVRIRTERRPVAAPVAKPKPAGEGSKQFGNALRQLEQALQDGALQLAAEQNKILQQLDMDGLQPTAEQAANLSRLRAELAHLQGWARWGANVSRDELLGAAEALPMQGLAPVELAKKVGSLRERWKMLDATAGAASKEAWLRFDQACTTAYAPAASYFQQLAAERAQNALQAEALISECRAFVQAIANIDHSSRDWKSVAGFLDRVRQAWHRLGPIDRKERKRLDMAFSASIQDLAGQLAEARSQEALRREQLIDQAAQLDPYARQAFDELRQLQERWQQQAKAMPLERRQEQQLWQRFRGQCDQIFASRKQASLSADHERRQHLQQKEALCSRLEAAGSAAPEVIQALLHETQQAWQQTGPVPRGAERQLEERYWQARQGLQQQLEKARQQQLAGQLKALQAKLRLCQVLEQRLAAPADFTSEMLSTLREEWGGLPPSLPHYDSVLQQRFLAAAVAGQAQDRAYLLTLERNQPVLQHELLRLEIITGLDSPAELARERLQMQVAVLQSSLKIGKAGKKQRTSGEDEDLQLLTLCRLPVLTDAETSQRISRILAHSQSMHAGVPIAAG